MPMLFNLIQYKPKHSLKLVMISPLLSWSVRSILILLMGSGLLLIIATINPNLPYLPIHVPGDLEWLGILCGFGLIVTAQLTSLADRILSEMKLACIFDVEKQAFYFTTPAKSVYSFLKTPIPFTHIQALRLKRIEAFKKPNQYLLELIALPSHIQPADTASRTPCFYPIGFFQDVQKVRRFIKTIQQVINVPCSEEIITDYSFRSQKETFLKQFEL